MPAIPLNCLSLGKCQEERTCLQMQLTRELLPANPSMRRLKCTIKVEYRLQAIMSNFNFQDALQLAAWGKPGRCSFDAGSRMSQRKRAAPDQGCGLFYVLVLCLPFREDWEAPLCCSGRDSGSSIPRQGSPLHWGSCESLPAGFHRSPFETFFLRAFSLPHKFRSMQRPKVIHTS